MDLFSAKIAYASVGDFVTKLDTMIIDPIIGFLFALAVLFFLYGVFEFLANQENEEKKTAGKSHMLWGIVGIVIMMSVFAIMNMIINTLGISGIDPEAGTVNVSH